MWEFKKPRNKKKERENKKTGATRVQQPGKLQEKPTSLNSGEKKKKEKKGKWPIETRVR